MAVAKKKKISGAHTNRAIEFYQVDAFTDMPFKGNPAGVCLEREAIPDSLMQRIAMEMNLPETAFILKEGDRFRLRWFTPKVEVDLCGHGTLASAHILFEKRLLTADETARFLTRSGELRSRRQNSWIELDFPQIPVQTAEILAELKTALGIHPIFSGKSSDNFFFEVEEEEMVRTMIPDFHTIGKHAPHGVIVTSRADTIGFDFVSRFFAPALGIDEDPVTGSAHCSLGPYWSQKLKKLEMTAYQASVRGGVVHMRLAGGRTFLSGEAVTVLEGTLLLP